MRAPEIVSDNSKPSDIGPEPDGFWAPVQQQIAAWADKYPEAQVDDAD